MKTASHQDYKYVQQIIDEMALWAQKRGVAVAQRPVKLVKGKVRDGLVVIAINIDTGEWVGFCYLEVWQHEKMVANSGLIIAEAYRGLGISREIKLKMFELSKERYPGAIILSLSTSPAVIHVNHHLGFTSISHHEVMRNEWFCNGSNSWVNFTVLMKNNH
ncbi:MAG: GNAT family N-acetyltransferase [Sphingobacteriales bacterium]|nr:GNAT family N-acetyltransferase [Sphingobacteriales bacterium]